MSAGPFTLETYGSSYDPQQSHPIRVQPETLAASVGGTANNPLVGAPTSPISALVSSSARSLGLHARIVYMRLNGAAPVGYSSLSRARLPILDPANFAAFAVKATVVDYLGTTWQVTGSRAEVTR